MIKLIFASFLTCLGGFFLHANLAPVNAGGWTETGGFTLNLSNQNARLAFDSLKARFNYGGDFDSVWIDDPEPLNTSSVPYVVFSGDSADVRSIFGFYLTKDIVTDEVTYLFSGDETDVERSWKCENNGGCDRCNPIRETILGLAIGAVTDCSCGLPTTGEHPNCLHSSAGGGVSAGDVLGFLVLLKDIFSLF